MKINERNIALRSASTNFPTLKDYMDRRKVIPLPFNEDAEVTVSGANSVLIDSTMVVATELSMGLGSTNNAGLFATLLPGAVGTASLNTTSDTLGNILNMVKIRNSTTHDPILEVGEQEVFGLIQTVSTAVDGDSIGGSGSENVQISFVYVASDGTLTLTNVTATIEFGQNNLYLERLLPTIMMDGGNPDADAITGGGELTVVQGEYVVTTSFSASEIITLSSGAGASLGVNTKTGDTINIGASSVEFIDNHFLQVIMNGAEVIKGIDVIWDTSGTLHFILPLDVDDYWEIREIS